MLTMSESKEHAFRIEKEIALETEPKPEKIFIFVRHPSVKLEHALQEGTDETPWDTLEEKVRIDREGGEMSRLLGSFFTEELPTLKEQGVNIPKLKIFSSPLIRAESLARGIEKKLEWEHKTNPDIPLAEGGVETMLNFSEIPLSYSKGEILKFVEQAKQEGKGTMGAMEKWFDSEPDKIAGIFESQRRRVEDGLEMLKGSGDILNVIFSHRLVIALTLWRVEQEGTDRKEFRITKEDLPRIKEIARSIPYTSLNEIRKIGDKLMVHAHGETPHLEKKPELRKGTF